MYKELRKKAEKKVQAKLDFYICVVVFSVITIILLMLGVYIPSISFWLKLPIPVFIMVLGVLYLTAFGLPSGKGLSDNWREEEIEKEMLRLYRQRKSEFPPLEELSETEKLELKELERIRNQKDAGEEYV